MSDFYQNGVVTVLHRLGRPNVDLLERELERYGRSHPIALVLPSLYAELDRPALTNIVNTLKQISYLNEIVISLDRASALEFRLAKQFFGALPQRVRVILERWRAYPGAVESLGIPKHRHRVTGKRTRVLDGIRLRAGAQS